MIYMAFISVSLIIVVYLQNTNSEIDNCIGLGTKLQL